MFDTNSFESPTNELLTVVPTPAQETALLEHCGHARFVWNLGLEQRLMWRPGRPPAPGYVAQAAQLTEARAAEPWLAAGSQMKSYRISRDSVGRWHIAFAAIPDLIPAPGNG